MGACASVHARSPPAHLFTSADVALRDSADEWDAVAASLGVAARRPAADSAGSRDCGRGRAARRGARVEQARSRRHPHRRSRRRHRCAGRGLRAGAPARSGRRVAGAVHAGWRGTAARVCGAAVRKMQPRHSARGPARSRRRRSARASACAAGKWGPTWSRRSGEAVRPMARSRPGFRPGRGDRSLLDLPRANRDQLVAAGVDARRIFDSGLCTKTHADRLHSYRADRVNAGRTAGHDSRRAD